MIWSFKERSMSWRQHAGRPADLSRAAAPWRALKPGSKPDYVNSHELAFANLDWPAKRSLADSSSADKELHMSRAGQEIDLDSLLPFMLNKVVRVMNASLEQALQEHGLSVAEWRVLATLDCTPVDRPSGISEFTGIELSTLSRTFDRLEKQGFVKRIKLPESGRAY